MLQLVSSPAHAVSAPSPLPLEQDLSSAIFQEDVLAPDAEATTAFNLALLWSALSARRVRHVRSFFTERDCHSLFEFASERHDFGDPLREVDLRTLETVVLGGTQKQISIGLGQSPSTVSVRLRRTLSAMGFPCAGSKPPLIVVLAAYAAHHPQAAPARAKHVEFGGKRCLLVSAGRPDGQLQSPLSQTESAVIRLLVEGLKHGEIARRRGTSLRTIANQISTAFKKLNVSGRSQLISHLIENARDTNPNARP